MKMRLFFKLLMLVIFLVMTTHLAEAYDFKVGKLCYNKNRNGVSVTVTHEITSISSSAGYTSLSGDIDIPSHVTYDGIDYTVTAIDEFTFVKCGNITSVTIPGTVTTIGTSAFAYCGLTSVTLPNSLKSIGTTAFYQSALTSINIPGSVTKIFKNAFGGCTKLSSVNVADLDSWCRIDFGDEYSNPLNFSHHLYLNDEEVTDLVIPNSLTGINKYAFFGCSGLTSVTFPDTITKIGYAAFKKCSGLTSVTIPNSVTTLDHYAFSGCSGLTNISLSNSLTEIGSFAFEDCSGLSSISIPSSVTQISYRAFCGCTGLKSVHTNDIAAWCKISFYYSGYSYVNDCSNPLHYAHHLYLNGVEIKKLVIPSTVTSISAYAFLNCVSLTDVTIPASVINVGPEAFKGCTGLQNVSWNVKTCDNFQSYDNSPFYSSTNIKTFTFGNEVERIPSFLCCNLTNLTNVDLPNPVAIGNSAFKGCSGLTNLTIGNSVVSIGANAFSGCSALTSIAIPKSVTSIGSNAFGDCTSLREVHIGDLAAWCGITFYSDSANPLSQAHYLYVSNQLNDNLVIPDAVKSVGNYAFNGCYNVLSFTIPRSVTSIGDKAFNCAMLKRINSRIEQPSIVALGEAVFSDVSKFTCELRVPAGTKGSYQSALQWKDFANIVEINNNFGDVDGNNIVNGSDVTSLYNYLLYGDSVMGDADVDGNGIVNGADVTALYNLLLK